MSEIGHNSAAGDRIRSYVARLERIQEGIDDLNEDKSNAYKDAKSEGLDTTALRSVIAKRVKRAKDPQKFDEQQQIVELYEAALGTDDATRAQGSGK